MQPPTRQSAAPDLDRGLNDLGIFQDEAGRAYRAGDEIGIAELGEQWHLFQQYGFYMSFRDMLHDDPSLAPRLCECTCDASAEKGRSHIPSIGNMTPLVKSESAS